MQIYQPLHLYFESELEELAKHFRAKGNKAGLKLIEPELALRRKETEIVKNQKFAKPKKFERAYKYFQNLK